MSAGRRDGARGGSEDRGLARTAPMVTGRRREASPERNGRLDAEGLDPHSSMRHRTLDQAIVMPGIPRESPGGCALRASPQGGVTSDRYWSSLARGCRSGSLLIEDTPVARRYPCRFPTPDMPRAKDRRPGRRGLLRGPSMPTDEGAGVGLLRPQPLHAQP